LVRSATKAEVIRAVEILVVGTMTESEVKRVVVSGNDKTIEAPKFEVTSPRFL